MQDDQRFRETYLALVALNWQALERIDCMLCDGGDAATTPAIEGLLPWLRLELLELDASAARCAALQRLSMEHHQLLQELVATLLDWLDFSATTAHEVMRLRLAAAQDWLLEEASRMGCDETSALDRLRG